jgi:hypothetical protein
MLNIDLRDDDVQARTTGLQAHADDVQAYVTDLREGEKERQEQG